MAHYAFLNNDATTKTLKEEVNELYKDMGLLTSIEEPTEEDTAAIEAKQIEIDAKQQEIDNCLCVVTGVITGVLETYEKSARDETIEQEIRDLEDSRTADKTQEEITAIEAEIQVKLEELHALPPEVIDNTVYWEGYYGKGGLCKRTSYNTVGGFHQNGGTPFRKNYAGVGYTYDPVRDAFYAPQPFESWTLNEDTCIWECPVEMPIDDFYYIWSEYDSNWIKINDPNEAPYDTWEWNEEILQWITPLNPPNDENSYLWDEDTQSWITE